MIGREQISEMLYIVLPTYFSHTLISWDRLEPDGPLNILIVCRDEFYET